MKNLSGGFSLPVKISFFSLVLTLIGVVGASLIAYQYADDLLQEKAREVLSQKVAQEGAVLMRVLKTIKEDAQFLTRLTSMQGIARALDAGGFDSHYNMTTKMWRDRLTSQMAIMLEQRDMYYQIRLIGVDNHGLEMIRVARLNESVAAVSRRELQHKGDRIYFKQGIKLAAGEVRFSEVSLNREHGQITLPPRPMLRVLSPIYGDKGDVFGLLVINVGLKDVAANLRKEGQGASYFIANESGDYLIHLDAQKAMAFEYGRESRVQLDYPSVVQDMKQMQDVDHKVQVMSFDLSEQGIALSMFHFYYDDADHGDRFIILGAEENMSFLQAASVQLRNQLFMFVFFLALLLALVTFFVVRRLTQPMVVLKAAVDRITHGEKGVYIPEKGSDEIASLGASFKDMLFKLEASRSTLKQSNVDLECQVDERTHEVEVAKQQLEEKNEALTEALYKAKQAVKAKGQFLATMSHEIRTPLNGVLGLTELVLDSHLTTQQRDHLEVVFASGETLLTVLNDILDFSKMEAGQFELSYCEFSPNDLIEQITKLYSQAAVENHIELIAMTLPKCNRLLVGDPDRLRQVLMNLLSNAVKFTEHGEVVMAVALLGEDDQQMKLRFSAQDTGIGVSAENQLLLFDDFSQVDGSHARKYGGTGLGLPIVRKLVHLMGGEIFVESEEGRGSRFWFDLDLEKGGELIDVTVNHVQDFKQWRVLVVDDNKTNLHVIEGMLDAWGSRHHAVERAKLGLTCLVNAVDDGDPFQLVLIDHMMPEMDGRELALCIQREPKLKHLKVVMLSSLDDVFDIHKKSEHGLHAFLRKPVHHSSLYNIILSVMHEVEPEAVEQPAQDSLQRHERILLVEDVKVNQMVALGMLKGRGFTHVDVASNGLEALALFSCGKYALILMDLQMPEMDGYTATYKIRMIEQAASQSVGVPIVALTAHAFSDEKKRSLDAGMNDLLTKPLTGKKLAAAVNHWLLTDGVLDVKPVVEATDSAGVDEGFVSLDEHLLRQLSDDMGGGIGDILDVYAESVPHQIEEICQALEHKDVELLARLAHCLKGSSRNLGALRLGEICEALEGEGDMSKDDVAEQVMVLRGEADAVLQALTAPWLKEVR